MPARPSVAFRNVSFAYDSAEKPLFTDLSVHFPQGFTGIVGANGAGKTSLLRLAVGDLAALSGSIEGTADAIYCAQRTDNPPESLQDFLEDWEGGASELKDRLNLAQDYVERWHQLSHGERKRAQIGHALWQSPSLLAIDEPTNHIDARARELLVASLRRFTGVGLIVSHDRELLDELCSQCVWLDPPDAQVCSGGVTQAFEFRRLQRNSAIQDRRKALKESSRLRAEVANRREVAAKEHKLRSKKGLSRKDSDARGRINRARVTDSGAGAPMRQLEGRMAQVQARLASAQVKKEYSTGIWVSGTQSNRDSVLKLAAGERQLSSRCVLHWPDVVIKPTDRIAVTGDNGAGKTSWLNHIVPLLNVPRDKVVFLPQEISAARARELIAETRVLPGAQLGTIMNIVSRLNSRPERLLESHQPSPGEARKLMLALGMSREPQVIVLDEPTNHLDLPSIEALEKALLDCPCALLLVSHDERFIRGVGARIWHIAAERQGHSVLSTP